MLHHRPKSCLVESSVAFWRSGLPTTMQSVRMTWALASLSHDSVPYSSDPGGRSEESIQAGGTSCSLSRETAPNQKASQGASDHPVDLAEPWGRWHAHLDDLYRHARSQAPVGMLSQDQPTAVQVVSCCPTSSETPVPCNREGPVLTL